MSFSMLWLSGEIRKDSFIMSVPFGMMIFLYAFVFPLTTNNLFESIKWSWKGKRKRFVMLVLYLFIVLIIVLGANKIYELQPVSGNFKKINSAGAEISDYIALYPNYDAEKNLYDNIGIPRSWLRMITSYAYSDENVFSEETMHLMQPLKGKSNLRFSDFSSYFRDNKLFWFSLIAFILVVFRLRGKDKSTIPLFASIFGVICFSIYCLFIGRIAWRVTSSYLLCGIVSFFAMSFSSEYKKKESLETETVQDNYLNKKIEAIVILSMVVFVWIVAVIDEKDTFVIPKSRIINQNQADALDCIDMDDKNVYLYDDLIRFVGTRNIWGGHESDYLDNYFPLSSSFIYGCKDKLGEYGIHDLYRSIITMPNIRVENQGFATETLYSYLKDFYDDSISMSVVDNIYGNLYIRYSVPMVPVCSQVKEVDCRVNKNSDITVIAGVDTMYDVGVAILSGDAEIYDDMLLNVYMDNGEMVSYGLNYKDSKASGTILCPDSEWILKSAKWMLVGRDKTGSYCTLADLSDKFIETIKEDYL